MLQCSCFLGEFLLINFGMNINPFTALVGRLEKALLGCFSFFVGPMVTLRGATYITLASAITVLLLKRSWKYCKITLLRVSLDVNINIAPHSHDLGYFI